MIPLIANLQMGLKKEVKTLACCCGHFKYSMTIVVEMNKKIFDLVSGKSIPRQRRFYKKDSEGYYYIPEVCEEK